MKKHTVWCVRAIGNYFLRTIFRIIEFWCVHAELPPGQCKAIFTSEYSSIRVWCVLQWHLYIFFSEILVSEGEKAVQERTRRGESFFWCVKIFRVLQERIRYWNYCILVRNISCMIPGERPDAMPHRSLAAWQASARCLESKIMNRSLHKYEYMFEDSTSSFIFSSYFF